MEKQQSGHRIVYIDLMKGVCITLVVIVHCDVEFPINILNDMFQNLRMPLYFFLSGLFFKDYNDFFEFVLKKINKNVIPYMFFAFVPYAIFDVTFNPEVHKTWLYYVLMLIEPYNFPLWFLRSLFISYVIYWFVYRIHSIFWRGVLVFLLSYISWRASVEIPRSSWSFLMENFLTSLFALPFIYIATNIRRMGVLEQSYKPKQLLLLFVVASLFWITCAQDNVYFFKADFGNTWPLLYFSAFGGIVVLWIICSKIRRLFYFSYVGRYSIVVLGTFCPIMRFLSTTFGITGALQAFITLAIMPVMIYFFIRIFPWFTAQKDLIHINK